MKRKQKRCVTLIEVLIAIILTVLILSTLTFFYRQVTEIGLEVDRVSGKNFKMRYIETRLAEILPTVVDDKQKDFVFFSLGDEGLTKPGSQSLIFTFYNDVSLAKAFSQNALARIYLDKNGNLMIAYWPSPLRWEKNEPPAMKKEMLYQGVDNLAFEFYIAPAVKEQEKAPETEKKNPDDKKKREEQAPETPAAEPEPKGEWRKQHWLEEYRQLPVMVKMILTMPKEKGKEVEPLIFIYPLVNAKAHVIYE